MKPEKSPAVVTITRALDQTESDMLIGALAPLCSIGLPVFAADAGSMPGFTERLRELPNLIRHSAPPGLVKQVKISIRAALDAGHNQLFYTEPDKADFFRTGLSEFIGRNTGEAVLIAARDPESFATFPATQQAPERAFNQLANELLGPLPDLLYGPLALSRQAAEFTFQVPDDLGWGWRTYVIARCALAALPIGSHIRPFACPLAQRALDEGIYRLQQHIQNVEGLRLALRDARLSS